MIFWIDAEVAFDKIQIFFNKNPPESRHRGAYMDIKKPYMINWQQTSSSLMKIWKHEPYSKEPDKGAHSYHYY